MHEYCFDVKLLATVRVKARSESEARLELAGTLDCASAYFGLTSDGAPLTGEASLDGEALLIEIDGEFRE